MNPDVLHEDHDVLVVAKPACLVVHADGRTEEPTLSDWVLARFPHLKDVGGLHTLDSGRYAPRAGIVHRLDRETSGVIIIAKHDDVFYDLQRQFLAHTVQKVYTAFTLGTPLPLEGDINLPIGRSRKDYRQWTTGADARGTLRKASTHYRVHEHRGVYALIELHPKTGRTHQLRVHLKAVGSPILCDSRYETPTGLGFTRLALHAQSLTIKHRGEDMVFAAPLPPDFVQAGEMFAQLAL
jgi:23S rRNA pseudouridine1911/1915/1917 synthase